ncbi:hypothetical protein D3C84_1275900 [compost metagenome]
MPPTVVHRARRGRNSNRPNTQATRHTDNNTAPGWLPVDWLLNDSKAVSGNSNKLIHNHSRTN